MQCNTMATCQEATEPAGLEPSLSRSTCRMPSDQVHRMPLRVRWRPGRASAQSRPRRAPALNRPRVSAWSAPRLPCGGGGFPGPWQRRDSTGFVGLQAGLPGGHDRPDIPPPLFRPFPGGFSQLFRGGVGKNLTKKKSSKNAGKPLICNRKSWLENTLTRPNQDPYKVVSA